MVVEACMEDVAKKSRFFFWLALKTKVLTWDLLQLRNKQSPKICMLCRNECETDCHIFIHCPYSSALWKEVNILTRVENVWLENTIEEVSQSLVFEKRINKVESNFMFGPVQYLVGMKLNHI